MSGTTSSGAPRGAPAILVFHPSAELYGADRALLQIVERLGREGFAFTVAVPRRGPLVDHLRAAGAQVEIGPLAPFGRATLRPAGLLAALRSWPASAAWARALVVRHAPDVVHSNTIVVQCGAQAARAAGVPHLWHLHEILERPRWLARALAFRVARSAEVVVHNSQATAEHWIRLAPGLRARSRVVANGVAGFAARPETADAPAARRALGLDPDADWIALVGRINAWKGQALLVEALARLRDAHPRAKVLLAGDPPAGQPRFLADLERRVRALGLEGRVRRLAFQREIDLVHAAASIVVVPSTLPEPFGLVAAEAMSMARPVVAARHGGLAEIVAHGETGLLFTPGDPGALSSALSELLAEPERARRMGEAGQLRQRARFDVERYTAEIAALYRRLAARRADAEVAA